MKQKDKDRLRAWFENLEHSKQIDIALECIEELIPTESISFWGRQSISYLEPHRR